MDAAAESNVIDPRRQREFARSLVVRLREAGFEAYWAGGCVRDQLLGIEPKDYDIATSARPRQVRRLFRKERTVAVGAAFGVIVVLGPPGAGQVEVATFRRDKEYLDGRRPSGVEYCGAEEDAKRRDFTINGLFYDPVEERVLDFVGGREDLKRGLIRAIGDPRERFSEDKLRLVRAVRFAARFGFAIEENTYRAIVEMADQLPVVSAERITAELERILTDPNRRRGLELLYATGLLPHIAPELTPSSPDDPWWQETSAVLEKLDAPSFPAALAAWARGKLDADRLAAFCRRRKLSNAQTARAVFILENLGTIERASAKPWSVVQPVLANEAADELLDLAEAVCRVRGESLADVAWCREKRRLPPEVLDPPALLDGGDLIREGMRPGPLFGELLAAVRRAQLDGELSTKEEALAFARRLALEREAARNAATKGDHDGQEN
ncbi:MAG: CCA tRNA nucleotidyltransferase [Planctomycetota bacterium]|nr:MAG: CCA tRNA nucleotidyltransferase [Planctomycetota bacterium]